VEQARNRGFVEEEYLAALRKVPRFSRERITRLMDYLVGLTKFLSRLSLGNLRLARAMAERRRAEELLSKSLEEKETLLKELQHRVKNSLGIVASLLSLNMADLRDDDSRRLFQEAVNRITSISMIYEELSGSSRIDQVDLGAYIRKLVALLSETYAAGARRVRVISESDAIPCSLKRAVSLGLILNELLTNALKYAYPPEDAGEIRIGLGRVDRSLELRVSDDGTGLPEGFDPKNPTGLGLRIAVLLAEEIGGSLRFETASPGTTAILNFAEF
jgi:two-component sensor histidine kinase